MMHEITHVRRTLNFILDDSCTRFADQPAVGMAMETPLTYRAFQARVLSLAARMRRDGLVKGERIAILAENSQNWGAVYLAAVRLGAVVVPLSPSLSETDVRRILLQIPVKLIFTSNGQLEKLYELAEKMHCPVVCLDDCCGVAGLLETKAFSLYLQEAEDLAAQEEQAGRELQFDEVAEGDPAAIVFSQGRSGNFKPVLLSHRNLASNAFAAAGIAEFPAGCSFLSILSASSLFEFVCGFLLPLIKGCRIAYAGRTPTPAILQRLCQYERPQVIFGVPLILEKIYKKRILPRMDRSRVMRFFKGFSFSRRMVYKKTGRELLDFFGGNLLFLGICGETLNPEVEQYLLEAHFPYLMTYGLTEAAYLVSGGPLGHTVSRGSVGRPLPGVQVRIESPDKEGIGEILVSGAGIMDGYFRDDEMTAEVLSADGWLSTGDLGFLDTKGNLCIVGRRENRITLPDGQALFPERIEQKLNAVPWVVESLVYAGDNTLEALVFPDYEMLDEQTAEQTRRQRSAYLERLFATLQSDVNKALPPSSQLSALHERREPFSRTASQHIKRALYLAQGR